MTPHIRAASWLHCHVLCKLRDWTREYIIWPKFYDTKVSLLTQKCSSSKERMPLEEFICHKAEHHSSLTIKNNQLSLYSQLVKAMNLLRVDTTKTSTSSIGADTEGTNKEGCNTVRTCKAAHACLSYVTQRPWQSHIRTAPHDWHANLLPYKASAHTVITQPKNHHKTPSSQSPHHILPRLRKLVTLQSAVTAWRIW